MKAIIQKASDLSYKKVKEINTLEELLKIHTSLIVETDGLSIDLYKKEDKGIDCVITIYDDYVE